MKGEHGNGTGIYNHTLKKFNSVIKCIKFANILF